MPAVEGLVVHGLADLQKAFRLADKATHRELRSTLRHIAEPVRHDVEVLALQTIPRMTLPWSRMRIGVTQNLVYVAPRERGRLTKRDKRRYARPNLAGLLIDRAFDPALQGNEPRIIRAVDEMLASVGRQWEQAA